MAIQSERLRVAVFVKTPGLSPIKTRLARDWGQALAVEFYLRSLRAVEAVLQEASRLHPSIEWGWAVAEEAGLTHSQWENQPRYLQKGEGLGQRLDSIYRACSHDGSAVALVGADCPLIRPSDIIFANQSLQYHPRSWVLGRAFDGGFYLFAGKEPIPPADWMSVSYSTDQTAQQLVEVLQSKGCFFETPGRRDIDTLDDLRALLSETTPEPDWLPEQRELWGWLQHSSK